MKLISKNKELLLTTPQIMGILNVTPDSFSDGGKFNQLDAALKHAEQMLMAGANILDIGGESTRPGAQHVSLQQELDRVVPIIDAIARRFDCWISIDTSKAQVMTAAVNAGASLINDVRALTEPDALETAAKLAVPVCLMHMQGSPLNMQAAPHYQDLLAEIDAFFNARIFACEQAGISKSMLILDPGFGFGKSMDHNYQLLAQLAHFHHYHLPLLAGMSRKSMVFKLLNCTPSEAISGSLACATFAALKGAQIIRVHDVKQTKDVLQVVEQIKRAELFAAQVN